MNEARAAMNNVGSGDVQNGNYENYNGSGSYPGHRSFALGERMRRTARRLCSESPAGGARG